MDIRIHKDRKIDRWINTIAYNTWYIQIAYYNMDIRIILKYFYMIIDKKRWMMIIYVWIGYISQLGYLFHDLSPC